MLVHIVLLCERGWWLLGKVSVPVLQVSWLSDEDDTDPGLGPGTGRFLGPGLDLPIGEGGLTEKTLMCSWFCNSSRL